MTTAKRKDRSGGKRRQYVCHLCGKTETTDDPREAFYRHYFEQHYTPAPF